MPPTEPKSRVSYYYSSDIGSQYYGATHPMKPVRIKMAHHLLLGYGLLNHVDVFRPHPADFAELTQFHSVDYIDFLHKVTPENQKEFLHVLNKFNFGPFTDCPIFPDLYKYCQLYAGASIDAAMRLNHGLCDVAINWSGGLHHAKKVEASGFCYVNDIVLGILELLKYHPRVLYIDIDIHHGDGVEEAFYSTDRVMTLSFHKYGDFFPGTGAMADIGYGQGRNYSLNVPLSDGITDTSFLSLYKPILTRVMETYMPTAVIVQCGADSLTGDRLGLFNLTTRGHGECVRFARSFGLPTMVLGGGGYNIRNVARCWAYETSLCAGLPLNNNIPMNPFYSFFAPDHILHITQNDSLPNSNSQDTLDRIKTNIYQLLSNIQHAPSVQMTHVPPDMYLSDIYTLSSDLNNHNNNSSHNNNPDLRAGGKYYQTHTNDIYNNDNNDNDDDNITKGRYVDLSSSQRDMEYTKDLSLIGLGHGGVALSNGAQNTGGISSVATAILARDIPTGTTHLTNYARNNDVDTDYVYSHQGH